MQFTISLLTLSLCSAVQADVLELTSGGRIEGSVMEQPASKDGHYVVALPQGGRVTLSSADVASVRAVSEAETEYERLARSSADTVEAHWNLVEWCREKKLRDHSQRHLERILELDPNHQQARAALGYRQKDGQWMQRDELMAARGLVLYEGQYVTPHHVELLKRQKEAKTTHADWAKTLVRLRRTLTGPRPERIPQALADARDIRDPAAAMAVVNMLRSESNPDLKRLWMEVAAGLDHQAAVNALVTLSLTDDDAEFRRDCLERLIQSGRPGLVTPYIRSLKDRDNTIINRAATALGQIGDREAIGPLIDALITRHRVQVSDAHPDQHAYSFSPQGGNAFSFGGGGPKFVVQPVQNPPVLDALVSLSGGISFDYDQEQWRRWLAAQANQQPVDLRRDQ